MKKLESSLKNMLLVLTGVTAISVALLAYVNELTKEPIAAANAKTLSDAVKAVVPGFDNDPIAEKKMQEGNGGSQQHDIGYSRRANLFGNLIYVQDDFMRQFVEFSFDAFF